MNRRHCLKTLGAVTGAAALPTLGAGKFKFEYLLPSALYGNKPLSQILPEIPHSAASGINIWSSPYGAQYDELKKMGADGFTEMLSREKSRLIAITCYHLDCLNLQSEMPLLSQLGGRYIVSGSPRVSKSPSGKAAKTAVLKFIEEMIPHADAAGDYGLKIAISNKSDQLLGHPDAIRYFAEFNRHEAMGIALSPQYLRKQEHIVPELILELGNRNLPFFYFQEYGDGAYHKLPKQIEMEQMPGRGALDYTMIVRALKAIDFNGVGELMMYTNPPGKPVLPTAEEITELYNESRIYIDAVLAGLDA